MRHRKRFYYTNNIYNEKIFSDDHFSYNNIIIVRVGSLDSMERGTVEWNSVMVERWNTGMVERAIISINDLVPFLLANWACALAIDTRLPVINISTN